MRLIPRKPLRLWPGVAAAVLLCLSRFVIPALVPWTFPYGLIGGFVCTLAIVVWWLFFSRAPWAERVGALALMVVAVLATSPFVHQSIAGGMMGMLLPVYAVPLMSVGLVAAVVISRRGSTGLRRAAIAAAILFACGGLTLLRTDGITGETGSLFAWRWTPTAEERLLARAAAERSAAAAAGTPNVAAGLQARGSAGLKPGSSGPAPPPPSSSAAKTTAAWPGFRGPLRDGVARGARIETDWLRQPPVPLWRKPIGPGWSSFSVDGDRLYTQEQRGDDEVVSCYRLTTGEPVWVHRDAVRFWESNGGAGPRATPTLSHGRVYAFGATGIVNALDAATGAVVWSRNAATDTNKAIPGWGFSSSPLVIDDVVIVAVSGQLVAYDAATGKPRWFGPTRGGGYSSPHVMTIDRVTQVVLLSGGGAAGVAPADGKVLWEHSWERGVSIVQPGLVPDGGVLISGGDTMGATGMRRLAVARGAGGWTVEERWTTRGLKPYFNDFVVHKGHAYGFDGSILASIDLSDGTRKWKGGRYGSGQLILLPDQDLLLVISEEGELALVKAAPDRFTELARAPAIDGKTWNHPVLVGHILLVRNGEEMAAFRLGR
jgi:outer membrane protein assembly factor BamB